MNVLLEFKKGKNVGLKIIVRLHTKRLKEKTLNLLKQDKKQEAFNLIAENAEFEAYVPDGRDPVLKPHLTLVEEHA